MSPHTATQGTTSYLHGALVVRQEVAGSRRARFRARTHTLSGPEHAGNKLAKFHFCFKNPSFSSLFACFEDPASGGSQALQWSDIYGGGRVWTTGRSVGPQGHQTLSLACPGTIPHRFPGPGAAPGLLSGTGAPVFSRIVFFLQLVPSAVAPNGFQ